MTLSGDAVAFRVDASPRMGIGHIMRCVALADALQVRGVPAAFFCRDLPEYLQEAVRAKGHDVTILKGAAQADDVSVAAEAMTGRTWRWLVVDHYGLDIEWETAMRRVAPRVLVIDDLADRSHDCDVLLDQNYYADKNIRYQGRVGPACTLLLGPRYALLRDEFGRQRAGRDVRGASVRRVLVGFGGTDAGNLTTLAIEALSAPWARALAVDVVIGAGHSGQTDIESRCAARGFACHVQSGRMAELMAAADVSIGAGGSTTWERCCLGLPTLVFCVAENQRQLTRDSAAAGLIYAPDAPESGLSAEFIGRHLQALVENAALRQGLARRAMEEVDGRGVARVLRYLTDLDIEVRPAQPVDSRLLFEWRNQPAVRAASHNSDLIPWASHEQWLTSVLANPDRLLLIGEQRGVPVGVVRFDIRDTEADVSIYLGPGLHEPGAGSQLLTAGERWLAASRLDVRRIRASVLEHNVVSTRLFAAAGYTPGFTSYTKALPTS